MERVRRFGRFGTNVAIETLPACPERNLTAILLNSGLLHRVGPCRLYVNLARRLSACGVRTVRFDLSGIGDSPVRPDRMHYHAQLVEEPVEAMDVLDGDRPSTRFVLIGLCSGAYSAFRTSCRDPRVAGAVLINPQDFVGHPDWTAHLEWWRYSRKRLLRPKSWLRLLTGRSNYARLFAGLRYRLSRLVSRKGAVISEATNEIRESFQSLLERGMELLFILSEIDLSVENVSVLMGTDAAGPQQHDGWSAHVVEGARHLFERPHEQQEVINAITEWVCRLSDKSDGNGKSTGT